MSEKTISRYCPFKVKVIFLNIIKDLIVLRFNIHYPSHWLPLPTSRILEYQACLPQELYSRFAELGWSSNFLQRVQAQPGPSRVELEWAESAMDMYLMTELPAAEGGPR
jgi:hypothetical protein